MIEPLSVMVACGILGWLSFSRKSGRTRPSWIPEPLLYAEEHARGQRVALLAAMLERTYGVRPSDDLLRCLDQQLTGDGGQVCVGDA